MRKEDRQDPLARERSVSLWLLYGEEAREGKCGRGVRPRLGGEDDGEG